MIKNSNFIISKIYSKDFSIPVWGMISSLPVLSYNIYQLREVIKHYKTLTPITKIGSTIISAIQTVSKSYDVYVAHKDLNTFQEATEKVNNLAYDLFAKIKNIKKLGWVVVHETEQEGNYEEGGKGGKNLIFKNLETGEIKTLDEMLKYTDFELSLWKLQRVKDSKKGTYLRRIKNNILEDNLG